MRKQKLVIIALGNRNSGKSNTWYELFGRVIRTGYKRLTFNKNEIEVFVKNSSFEEEGTEISNDVFVRNSSFEEWGDEADDFFDVENLPQIVLCSVQYKEKGIRTINFFKDNGYYIYIQWLNPGYRDYTKYDDNLGFEKTFKPSGEFHIVNAKEKYQRVLILKEFLYNWFNKK